MQREILRAKTPAPPIFAADSTLQLLGLILAATATLFISGCSSQEKFEVRQRGLTAVITPKAPVFFTGTACVLLTNAGGFSARVTVQTEGLSEKERVFSGQLLGLGSKLLFAPDPTTASSKRQRDGGFSFIWDAAENRGYALSEALQAYAPISSRVRATNVVISAATSATPKQAGHVGELIQATVQKDDGTSAEFEILRAADVKGFPVKITSITNAVPLTLSFSKIRLEAPGPEVFMPPDGFTKYTSTEAMADELAARQHNLNRKHTEDLQPFTGYPTTR